MSINLKELSSEFNNLKLDYNLKKKNWLNFKINTSRKG